jgi:hypothetical protein
MLLMVIIDREPSRSCSSPRHHDDRWSACVMALTTITERDHRSIESVDRTHEPIEDGIQSLTQFFTEELKALRAFELRMPIGTRLTTRLPLGVYAEPALATLAVRHVQRAYVKGMSQVCTAAAVLARET